MDSWLVHGSCPSVTECYPTHTVCEFGVWLWRSKNQTTKYYCHRGRSVGSNFHSTETMELSHMELSPFGDHHRRRRWWSNVMLWIWIGYISLAAEQNNFPNWLWILTDLQVDNDTQFYSDITPHSRGHLPIVTVFFWLLCSRRYKYNEERVVVMRNHRHGGVLYPFRDSILGYGLCTHIQRDLS